MSAPLIIQPIAGFKALDGCHCVTSSFKKMYAFNDYGVEVLQSLDVAVAEFLAIRTDHGGTLSDWHGKTPSKEESERALAELK